METGKLCLSLSYDRQLKKERGADKWCGQFINKSGLPNANKFKVLIWPIAVLNPHKSKKMKKRKKMSIKY